LVEKGSGGKIIGELSQIPLSPSIVVTKTYPPIFAVELQPGLVYREAIENDLDVWEKQIIQSGLYEKEDAWIQAATWLSDPLIWCITTIWRDEIIQIECYHFDKDKDTKVWGGFASHIDRTRPHWFWTKMSKILFKAFAELGIERMDTKILVKYPDYIEFLKKTYGAIELDRGLDTKNIPLRYYIQECLKVIPEWPEKRTLPNWSWSRNSITVREGNIESDYSTVLNFIHSSWGDNSRKNVVLTNFDKWLNLDKANLLLAYKDNNLVDARLYRHREGDLCGSFLLVPLDTIDPTLLRIGRIGFLSWVKEIGYKKLSFRIEERLMPRLLSTQSGKLMGMGSKYLAVTTRYNQFSDLFTEITVDVDKLLEGVS